MLTALLTGLAAVVATSSLLAQSAAGTPLAPSPYPDARTAPKGVLRVGFEPEYLSYREVFGPDGTRRPLGWSMTSDSAGADLFASAQPAASAVERLLGLGGYRLSIGALTTTREADIRRFPLSVQLGVSQRLSLTATIPFVTTRAQVSFTLDTVGANAGLNPALLAGRAADVAAILDGFAAQADSVEQRIRRGDYGCPSSPTCDQARDVVARTRAAVSDLRAMTGVATSGVDPNAPPFVPLAASAAGQAIQQVLSGLRQELAALGATPPAGAFPLATRQVDSAGLQSVLQDPAYGYGAAPLAFRKYRQKLGDLEFGLRWGVVQHPKLRAVLAGTARLPTGMRDDPDDLVDIGTGDRQTDVIGAVEAVWTPNEVTALAFAASYTLQLEDRVPRRVTPPGVPFNVAESRADVERDLGDVVRLSAYPSVRLSEAFTAYGSVHYFRKGEDRYSRAGGETDFGGPPPAWYYPASVLAQETAWRSLSFGGGVHYDAEGGPAMRLPIQAGIDYRAAFRGREGTPMDARVSFYLRLYYRVFQ